MSWEEPGGTLMPLSAWDGAAAWRGDRQASDLPLLGDPGQETTSSGFSLHMQSGHPSHLFLRDCMGINRGKARGILSPGHSQTSAGR